MYNIGLPRTGTRSINHLFNTLGFKTNHSLLTDEIDYNIEYDNVTNNLDFFKKDDVFYSDTPIWNKIFWQLTDLYDKKVICTYRDKDSWIKSIKNFSYFKLQKFKHKDSIWFRTYFDNLSYNHLSNVYDEHNENIKKFNNLLKIDIINGNNVKNLEKIEQFLNIKIKNYEIINYNTLFQTK